MQCTIIVSLQEVQVMITHVFKNMFRQNN